MFTSTLRRASKRTFCGEKYNKLIEVNKKLELERTITHQHCGTVEKELSQINSTLLDIKKAQQITNELKKVSINRAHEWDQAKFFGLLCGVLSIPVFGIYNSMKEEKKK